MNNINMGYLHWGPCVGITKVDDHIIERLHKDGKKELESYNKSLAGHLKSQFKFNLDTAQWFYEQITPILQAYRKTHLQYHNLPERRIELAYHDLWINFMKAGDFNPSHNHHGDYSFVIFVDVPKKLQKEIDEFEGTGAKPGSLLFEYGQQARPKWATTGHAIIPETGMMYIFPALTQHWVHPFKSKCTRVSVSGNMVIENRHELPDTYF